MRKTPYKFKQKEHDMKATVRNLCHLVQQNHLAQATKLQYLSLVAEEM